MLSRILSILLSTICAILLKTFISLISRFSPIPITMGAWGLGLFQSDYDWDVVGDLSDEAGTDLLHPEDVAKARKILDSGVLDKMVAKLLPDARDPIKCAEFFGERPNYKLVILGACAMQVGAKVPEEVMQFMKENYRKINLQRDALTQMEIGLREYAFLTCIYFLSCQE